MAINIGNWQGWPSQELWATSHVVSFNCFVDFIMFANLAMHGNRSAVAIARCRVVLTSGWQAELSYNNAPRWLLHGQRPTAVGTAFNTETSQTSVEVCEAKTLLVQVEVLLSLINKQGDVKLCGTGLNAKTLKSFVDTVERI